MAQSRRVRGGALDAIDRQIIAALHRDGRAQSTAIGEELGLSGNLVATRIRAMDAAGTMRVVAVADFRVHGYRMLARIRVKPNGRAPLDIANELARREDVLSVHLTSGAYPVSCLYAFVNARDLIEAARAVSADIAGVEDVDVELLNTVYRYRPAIGPIAEPGAIGPIAEPGAIGPIAEPGAIGPIAEPGAIGPIAEPGA